MEVATTKSARRMTKLVLRCFLVNLVQSLQVVGPRCRDGGRERKEGRKKEGRMASRLRQ